MRRHLHTRYVISYTFADAFLPLGRTRRRRLHGVGADALGTLPPPSPYRSSYPIIDIGAARIFDKRCFLESTANYANLGRISFDRGLPCTCVMYVTWTRNLLEPSSCAGSELF